MTIKKFNTPMVSSKIDRHCVVQYLSCCRVYDYRKYQTPLSRSGPKE